MMNACSLEPGTKLIYRGERCVVESSGQRGVSLLAIDPKPHRIVSNADMQAALASGELKVLDLLTPDEPEESRTSAPIPKGLSEYSAAARKAVAIRKKYLEAICPTGRLRFPRRLVPLALREAWKSLPEADRSPAPPSVSSVYEWRSNWIKSSFSDVSLVPRVDKRGRRPAKLPDDLMKILVRVVEEEYATDNRPTVAECLRSATHKVNLTNRTRPDSDLIPTPTRVQMLRAIETFDPYRLLERRYGKATADERTRIFGAGPGADRLLERVEVDHTRLDVICVARDTLQALGRPWMTSLIDVASRMIIGIWISFHTPNANTVLRVLKQAIRRKGEVLKEYGLEGKWPCYGVPQSLIMDNGKEFHSKALDAAAQDLNMHLVYCPKETPHFKGVIERWHRSMNTGVVHIMPGTTFSNPEDRGNYDAQACAVLTVDEVRQLIYKWMVEVYALAWHRSLGAAPLQRWNELAAVCPPQMPKRPEVLDVYLRPQELRTLTSKGIEINTLFYTSRKLEALRLRNALRGRDLKLQIRANHDNLGAIEVLHPETDTYFTARCTRPDYAEGMTLEQHKFHRKNAARKYAQLDYLSALLASKQEIRDMLQAAVRRAKRRAALQAAADSGEVARAKVATREGRGKSAPKSTGSRRATKAEKALDRQAAQVAEQFGAIDARALGGVDAGLSPNVDDGQGDDFDSFDDVVAFGPTEPDLFS